MIFIVGYFAASTDLPEMVLGTRYDKRPYMRKFLRAREGAEPDLESRAGLERSLIRAAAEDHSTAPESDQVRPSGPA